MKATFIASGCKKAIDIQLKIDFAFAETTKIKAEMTIGGKKCEINKSMRESFGK
jgi:hypothetical protein